MKLIKQVDVEGCGIACVAMLLGKSYETVREELFRAMKWTAETQSLRTHADGLMKILAGVQHKKVKYRSFDSIQSVSILAVNPLSKEDYHWVVAFRSNGCLWIADPELGELYRYHNWSEDEEGGYTLANYSSIKLPTLNIDSVVV